MNQAVSAYAQQAVLQAAQVYEQAVDDELSRLDNTASKLTGSALDKEDDLEAIRARRLAEMRREHEAKNKWRHAGHGSLQDLHEREFFDEVKKSERVVACVCRPGGGGSRYTAELVEHLGRLAGAHMETRFVTLDAEKATFICERLRIRMLPTMVLIKEGKVDHMISGLSEIHPSGKYDTAILEQKLFEYKIINNTGFSDKSSNNQRDYDDE